jgi:hypothetical protein
MERLIAAHVADQLKLRRLVLAGSPLLDNGSSVVRSTATEGKFSINNPWVARRFGRGDDGYQFRHFNLPCIWPDARQDEVSKFGIRVGASSSPSFREIPVIHMDRTHSHVEHRIVLNDAMERVLSNNTSQSAMSVEGRIAGYGAGKPKERIFLMNNETYVETVSTRVAMAILLQRALQEPLEEPLTKLCKNFGPVLRKSCIPGN